METAAVAKAVSLPQKSNWERIEGGTGLRFLTTRQFAIERKQQTVDLRLSSARLLKWNGAVQVKEFDRLCACNNKKSGDFGPANICESVDEALILKRKANEVVPYLNERCIYLVGMMGSGKTTVGKILAEVLGYSFFDSDKLVEQAVGMESVAEIFKKHSEAFFRDSESEVLRELSSMRRLVVATGGGAVIRPINWRYMNKGISVWLDVPLETLARRIAAVGTASRPLLHDNSGDPYTKAFARLSTLMEQRGKAYANAVVRVSLQHMADKKDLDDVSKLTPTDIATEALIQIKEVCAKDAALGKFY